MKVLVISLITSPERRASVTQKLAARNIAFEFIDAVDGRLGLHPYLANYDEQRFIINRRRKAAKGELGCYASHILAWEKCVELNEPVVVLEDDFEMTDAFEAGLAYLDQFTDKLAFVRLEPLEKKLVFTSHQNAQFKLVKQLNVGMCTTGYLVTPPGAKAFLEHGTRIRMPVDLFLKYTLTHQQVMHALVPNIVYPTHADSIIGVDFRNLREKGALLALKRFAFKTAYALGNFGSNLVNGMTHF